MDETDDAVVYHLRASHVQALMALIEQALSTVKGSLDKYHSLSWWEETEREETIKRAEQELAYYQALRDAYGIIDPAMVGNEDDHSTLLCRFY